MRYRALTLVPLLWTAAFVLLALALQGSAAYPVLLRADNEIVKALAVWGAWAAALRFRPGEYPRLAWFLIGLCMALLLLRDLTLLGPLAAAFDARALGLLRAVLVSTGNLANVAGVWLLARSWKRAALSLPGTPAQRGLVSLAAAGVALALAGPAVVTQTRAVLAGDLVTLNLLASALGDMLALYLIAPLLFTALALRGGLIGRPWTLLTASALGWLGYDAVSAYAGIAGQAAAPAAVIAAEAFRALGSLYGFSAGLVQRFVLDDLVKLGAAR